MSTPVSRWSRFLERVRGVPVQTELQPWSRWLGEIRRRGAELGALDDVALRARADALRRPRASGDEGATIDLAAEARLEALAIVAEVARRTVGLAPYDVQLLGGMALCDGALVEMQTGEGKTLVAVFPAALQALAGGRAHVLTFNDYLARRDAAWMGPIYRFLGLSVGTVQDASSPAERRQGYAADVTYATAKQVGFDRLRDGVALEPGARVLGPLDAAIVDEADALLIDEARVPLVLAGVLEPNAPDLGALAVLVDGLVPGEDFEVDGLRRIVTLTDRGLTRCEEQLGGQDLHAAGHDELLAAVHCALHARALLQRDRDYLVRDDRIELVDENTGRVVRDRKWPEGLHAAVEAKERVSVRPPGALLATTTVRELLGGYARLCGMTATARPAAEELHELYGLETVVIPPNVPCVRQDAPDRVFTSRALEEAALVEEVRRVHATGRPLLVGTRTVEESEALAAVLGAAGLVVQVLNARHDQREAEIIAEAGRLGAVTIATNMAGRGTDIRLGGSDEAEHDRVAALGGLYVLGTNRHDSRRIDDQLRGRAGRQGDPGSSQFFVSLEDELAMRAGGAAAMPGGARAPAPDGVVDNPVLTRWLDHLQRVVEGQSAAKRRGVAAYGVLLEEQAQLVQGLRDDVLAGHAALSAQLAAEVHAEGAEAWGRVVDRVVLLAIDRQWSQHVSFAFALRESIGLERLAGRQPRVEYDRRLGAAFAELLPAVRRSAVQQLAALVRAPGPPDLADPRLGGPSSTWTYLVDDDPFGERFAAALPSSIGVAAGFVWPLLLLWGVVRAAWRRREREPP